MEDQFDLQRFLNAQSSAYPIALFEISKGQKKSHWMWYIFPQYNGLGHSDKAVQFAIKSREEAIHYLKHPILGARLIEITQKMLSIENKAAYDILGTPDDLKLKSCMTLFSHSLKTTQQFDC